LLSTTDLSVKASTDQAPPRHPVNSERQRFAGLDGLRAVAVLGVILFHLRLPGVTLGWSGILLFYVISGFLITTILLETKTDPHYFRNFYARRTLRIFPLYFVSLAGLIGAALLLKWPLGDLPYYCFYFQNHLLAATRFQPNFPTGFNHTWTLAVEEQFYLVWPLLVRGLSIPVLRLMCFGLILVAPVARALLVHTTHNPFMALNLLVCNVDSLAIGAIMGIALHEPGMTSIANDPVSKRWCVALCAATLSLAMTIVLHYGRRSYWSPVDWLGTVNWNMIFPTVLSFWFATVIFYVVNWDSLIRRVLDLSSLRYIGRISYGIYVFHGLVLTYAVFAIRVLNPRWPESKIVMAVCNLVLPVLLAVVSWHVLERPFLRQKQRFA
jgi:peptidoglycan/LPS O-acetylase OafA/YrhL